MKNSTPIMKWADGSRTTNIPLHKLSLGKLESIKSMVAPIPISVTIHGFTAKQWWNATDEEIKGREAKCLGFLLAVMDNYPSTKFIENIMAKGKIFNTRQFARAREIIGQSKPKFENKIIKFVTA